MNTFSRQSKRQEGFVILFSIVVSAIVLLITAGMFQIASKQTVLSATSRESVRAFYAADSGIECALGNEVGTALQIPSQIDCDGVGRAVDIDGTFFVSFDDMNACARVTISEAVDPVTGVLSRQVVSRGFNALCDSTTGNPDYNYRSLVERSIRIRFVQNVATTPPDSGTDGLGSDIKITPTDISVDTFPPIDISQFSLNANQNTGIPETPSGL